VQVPLLDLETYAGGLTPEELGGGLQTRSLKLKSAEGREFALGANRHRCLHAGGHRPGLGGGEESSKLHAAGGGGMWLSFFEERNTVSLAIASGAEGTRWYLRTGVTF
jgi:hypothetical protein